MNKIPKPTLANRLKNIIFGRAIDPTNRQAFHSISIVAFIAWVGLGSDGLSSSAYGPEEAFLALGTHNHLAIIIASASASDAIFSFLPANLYLYKLEFSLVMIGLLTLLNMRGAKETVVPLVPIFMVFILTHAFTILYGLGTHLLDFPTVAHETVREVSKTHAELGLFLMIFLIVRAFSMEPAHIPALKQ